MSVVLGGTAQFNCSPTVDGQRAIVIWIISPPQGGGDITLRMNESVLGTPAFVIDDYRSILIFANVSRDLNGARIFCGYDNGVFVVIQPQQSRPTITVLCELFSPLILIDTPYVRLYIM